MLQGEGESGEVPNSAPLPSVVGHLASLLPATEQKGGILERFHVRERVGQICPPPVVPSAASPIFRRVFPHGFALFNRLGGGGGGGAPQQEEKQADINIPHSLVEIPSVAKLRSVGGGIW